MLFFIGLLAGIVPLLVMKAKGSARRIATRDTVLALISLVTLFALSRAAPATAAATQEHQGAVNAAMVLYILLAGIINGATLLIPGLSGAFLLLVMGLYPLVIYSISSVGAYISDPGNFALLRDILIVLAPFVIGGLAGCIGIARLMEKLLRDYHESAYAVILGLVLGSVVILAMDPIVYQSGTSPVSIVIGIIMLCAGCCAAYIMGKRSEK
jgi:putative membrane protein